MNLGSIHSIPLGSISPPLLPTLCLVFKILEIAWALEIRCLVITVRPQTGSLLNYDSKFSQRIQKIKNIQEQPGLESFPSCYTMNPSRIKSPMLCQYMFLFLVKQETNIPYIHFSLIREILLVNCLLGILKVLKSNNSNQFLRSCYPKYINTLTQNCLFV